MNLTVEQVTKFESLLTILSDDWKKVKPVATGWFSHISFNNSNLVQAFNFLISGVDQFVALADQLESSVAGADKKAIVLASANKLFDLVVAAEIPLAFQPFASILRSTFDALLNALIEYVVTKLPSQAAPKTV